MSKLSYQPNIGKELEAKLIQVEIETFEKLIEAGAENAFIKIKTVDPSACINMLYALEGAIQGIRWHGISKERKLELLNFFRNCI